MTIDIKSELRAFLDRPGDRGRLVFHDREFFLKLCRGALAEIERLEKTLDEFSTANNRLANELTVARRKLLAGG